MNVPVLGFGSGADPVRRGVEGAERLFWYILGRRVCKRL